MAEFQDTRLNKTHSFTGGMVKDLSASFTGPSVWTHMRNGVNNSHNGELGTVGNEPSNVLLTKVPYTIIGSIHLYTDKWAIFSTDDQNSEVGIFDESDGSYKKVVNDPCLSFNRKNLITGVAKENWDCTWSVYFVDSVNPDRILNLDNPPYKEEEKSKLAADKCLVTYTDELDCEKLRMSRLLKTPKIRLTEGYSAGNLLNGSYQAVIAYSVNGVVVTDYFLPSNSKSIFSHQNVSGSLELNIEDIDKNFDEFELVIISNVNHQTQAKRVGFYSTRQKTVFIGALPQSLVTVPLEYIPKISPYYDNSDGIFEVNNYLLRVGPRTNEEINYQQQANKIRAKWVAAELPSDYYYNGGTLTSYMGDENYIFYIRWVRNSGHKTNSFALIPKEAAGNDKTIAGGDDAFETKEDVKTVIRNWEVNNTAKITKREQYDIPEGRVIYEGDFGYCETTEKYPDNNPEVWGDLCGENIRLFKFPDRSLVPHVTKDGTKIVALGVKFENITHPVDAEGQPIADIVGYEILRGSRDGNKTIIAKGQFYNTGQYTIPDNISDKIGLYPNYGHNDVRIDPYLSASIVQGGCQQRGYTPMGTFRKDVFTFHSPETQFRNPFLSVNEMKIEAEVSGTVTGNFEPVFKHPRHKLIRDFALLVSGLIGVGVGMIAVKGKKTTTIENPRAINLGATGTSTSLPLGAGVAPAYNAASLIADLAASEVGKFDITGVAAEYIRRAKVITGGAMGAVPGTLGATYSESIEHSANSELPLPLRIVNGVFLFTYHFAQGTESALRVIRGLVPYQQYAYQYNSHGLYTNVTAAQNGNKRRKITEANYLEPNIREFTNKYRVNNLFRSRQVILEVADDIEFPVVQDTTRTTIGEQGLWDTPTKAFNTVASSYYGSIKVPMKNQYGQLDSVVQIPVSTNTHFTEAIEEKKFQSPVLFGGDIYIGRHTEKNTMFFFNDWLHDVVDGFELDYNRHYNLPYPRYWINTEEYDISQLTSALVKLNFKENALPNDLASLDRRPADCAKKVSFIINKAYFYLFHNTVKDFYVESEINLALRDYNDTADGRHYDHKEYTDLKTLFRSDIIRNGNTFKYDESLSVSKLLSNYISWSSMNPRDYKPGNEKCFSYYPDRIIYSLPHQLENKKDNWLAFLANNYKDFQNKISGVKPINKSGALILFENESPIQFHGIDQLNTEGGIKITIGDGGLFHQPLQNIVNSDKSYEYASCQHQSSVIATPQGVFWVSQDQGKIFHFHSGLQEFSRNNLKFWLAEYLPSKLLEDFPEFELKNNPVIGIGVQSIYDNVNEVIYFCKKDYELKDEFRRSTVYLGGDRFSYNGFNFQLGDTHYFSSASFTVSYDLKSKAWISYHDWFPDQVLPSKNHFLTTKNGGIWQHNSTCESFCNFYGVDYPFEIEYPETTGQEVTILKSIEYVLECYKFFNKCRDSHHILDENFDRCIVYNTEQISGLAELQMKPKNSPATSINQVQSKLESIRLFCTKEENKYRVHGFTDLTKDRGEFTGNTRQMFITEPNGYLRQLNPGNVNYNKSLLERKKFRHYLVKILLRKNKSGSTKMIFKISNTKNTKSIR